MARRKLFKRRSSSRGGYFSKRSRSRSSAKGGQVKLIQFDAMIYGGARGYLSNALAPITAKIPLGNVADEIVMGGICYLTAKNTSGLLKDVAMKGLIIENARLGEAIATGELNLLGNKSSGSTAYEY